MKIKNILLLPLLLSLSLVYAEKRALVIGNSDYKNAKLSYLPNATKDAKLIKETLEKLGFKVLYIEDANKQAIDNAVDKFSDSIKKGDMAFFYYAGHGTSQGGQNYLIPLNSGIKSAKSLPYQAKNAKEILDLMSDQAKNAIFVLDACRNVAFKRSTGRGLQSFSNNTGTYVIYSAGEGQTASDNRVFATSLSNELLKPQSIRDVALETRRTVYKSSEGGQYPATYDQLLDKVYLNGKPNKPISQPTPPTEPTPWTAPTPLPEPIQHKPIPQPTPPTEPTPWTTPTPLPKPIQPVQSLQTQLNQAPQTPQKQGTKIDHYIAYDDGTALDKNTGLLWQRCSVGQQWNGSICTGKAKKYKWAEAMKLGDSGWRLPTIKELVTIVYCSSGKTKGSWRDQPKRSKSCAGNYQRPTINTQVFPIKMGYPYYWSSSPGAYYDGDYPWAVDFDHGHDGSYKDNTFYVRLVRGGK